jgi:cytoskeletal protein CcmA (bactofilin family)
MQRRTKESKSWLLAVGLALLLLLGLTGTALAVDFRGGDTVTIGKDEVIDDDLVVSGATVIVDGVVNGDLIAAGADIIVNGKVNGSLMMAGRTLTLNGQVGGTVYSAGAAITVGPQATVARSVFFAGYSYTAASGSVVGRDNVVAGYQAILKGEVQRDLLATLGALELNGTIGRNVMATVAEPGTATPQFWAPWDRGPALPPSVVPGLRIGPEAKIVGKLMYTSPVEQNGAVNITPAGGIVYSQPQTTAPGATATPVTPPNATAEWAWARLREFVSLLVIGLFALWLLPVFFERVAERTQAQPWLAAAWGILVGIVGYGGALLATILIILAVAGLAALTLAGLATTAFGLGFSAWSMAFTLFLLLGAYGSKLVVLYPLSHALLARILPQWNSYRIVPLAVGILFFVLLRSIPYLGMLIEIAVTLIGLGALWLVFRERFAKSVASPLVLAPA